MQRTWTDRRKRVIFEILSLLIIFILITLDQLTKFYFKENVKPNEIISIIDGFFYFTYTVNTGAAWSFLAGVPWAQTFFKILTGVALVGFIAFYIYSGKKNYKWLKVALILVLSGTIGNYIDRLAFNGVTDFIGFTFGSYNFPVFNLADTFLTIGVIMIIIHYLFLDESAIFRSKNGKENISDNK